MRCGNGWQLASKMILEACITITASTLAISRASDARRKAANKSSQLQYVNSSRTCDMTNRLLRRQVLSPCANTNISKRPLSDDSTQPYAGSNLTPSPWSSRRNKDIGRCCNCHWRISAEHSSDQDGCISNRSSMRRPHLMPAWKKDSQIAQFRLQRLSSTNRLQLLSTSPRRLPFVGQINTYYYVTRLFFGEWKYICLTCCMHGSICCLGVPP
jgi:hypothetical protein